MFDRFKKFNIKQEIKLAGDDAMYKMELMDAEGARVLKNPRYRGALQCAGVLALILTGVVMDHYQMWLPLAVVLTFFSAIGVADYYLFRGKNNGQS